MVPLALTLNPIRYSSSLKPQSILRRSPPPPPSFCTLLPDFKSSPNHYNFKLYQRKIRGRGGTCRAELSHDAPFAVAIGACMLSSLVLPVAGNPEDNGGDSALDSTDSRLVAMAIISFIPYFNWLSWIFAWLDTGSRRYAVYSLVYLAPYLRSNLSLSPEDSWLPIASIIFCIVHVQLETSIKNGDIQGFPLLRDASKRVSSTARRRDSLKDSRRTTEEGGKKKQMNLPSTDEQSRNKLRDWGVPTEPLHDNEHLNEDNDNDERGKQ